MLNDLPVALWAWVDLRLCPWWAHGMQVLHPGLYHAALEDTAYYLFTGGGTVLNVIEANDPYGLDTVKALMENGERFGTASQRHLTEW